MPKFTFDKYPGLLDDIHKSLGTKEIATKYYLSGRRVRELKVLAKDYSTNQESTQNDSLTLKPSASESVVQTKDKLSLSLPPTRIHTLEALIKHFEIDLDIWEVDHFQANKWEVASKGDNGFEVEPLYQVKATFKHKIEMSRAKDSIEALVTAAQKHMPVYPNFSRARSHSGLLGELSIFDAHIGKHAWAAQTGEDYDLKIAESLYLEHAEDLIVRLKNVGVERILYIVGNDFINCDNLNNTTTKGTPQDMDGRYQKVFTTGREIAVKTIDMALSVAPVDVLMVSGNHDQATVFSIGDSLQSWYRNCSDVSIDNAPTHKKYKQWGMGMIQFIHGDKQKPKDLPLQMAQDKPKMWADTCFRESHLGHFHTFRAEEFKGIRVRTLPSISAADQWHSENGYDHNLRTSMAFVWDKEKGVLDCMESTKLPSNAEYLFV